MLPRGPMLEALRSATFDSPRSSKEIVMNTSKVIELGKVSEETKGLGIHYESVGNPVHGPEG